MRFGLIKYICDVAEPLRILDGAMSIDECDHVASSVANADIAAGAGKAPRIGKKFDCNRSMFSSLRNYVSGIVRRFAIRHDHLELVMWIILRDQRMQNALDV